MKPVLYFIFRLTAILIAVPGVCQETGTSGIIANDSLASDIPKTSLDSANSTSKETFISPFIMVDYGKALASFSTFESKYEGGVGVVFRGGLMLVFEAGKSEISPRNAYENIDYSAEGSYIRPGLSVRMSHSSKNSVFFGLKYGQALFSDQYSIVFTPSESLNLFEDFELNQPERKNLSANWFELSLMTEKHINPFISVGFHLRFKYLSRHTSFSPVDVFSIPGYGRSIDKTIPAANLYFVIRWP